MDFFLVSPEMSGDVNDSQNYEESGPYRGFGSANSYVNAKSMYSDIHESNFHYTALDIDKLRIGDEEIVQKSVCGIQDPHSNTKRPGELLASNISSPKPRKRSVSSMSTTPRRNKSPEESTKKGYSSFQRSLKLLGLQPEDFGINNKINISSSHTSSYRVGPTFHTRLTKRSSSLENLRSAVLSHMAHGRSTPGEHLDRRILSNAVYEEWYFQKLEEAHRKKKAEELSDQKKEEHIEKVKAEQKQKAEENFNEWKKLKKNKQRQQRKQQEGQKKLENKAGEDFRLTDGTKVRRNQEEVFLVWKKEKDKLLKQRKLKQKIQKETVKPDNDKNAAAEMTFKLWKKQADETLKEKAQEEKRRKQEEEEAKKEKERVKRESAEASFCAWKKKKDSELKKKMMEDRLAEEQKKSAKLIREAERLYEAEQVFQEWLDQVEERQNKQIDYVQKRKEKNLHQFPWNPGGSVHW